MGKNLFYLCLCGIGFMFFLLFNVLASGELDLIALAPSRYAKQKSLALEAPGQSARGSRVDCCDSDVKDVLLTREGQGDFGRVVAFVIFADKQMVTKLLDRCRAAGAPSSSARGRATELYRSCGSELEVSADGWLVLPAPAKPGIVVAWDDSEFGWLAIGRATGQATLAMKAEGTTECLLVDDFGQTYAGVPIAADFLINKKAVARLAIDGLGSSTPAELHGLACWQPLQCIFDWSNGAPSIQIRPIIDRSIVGAKTYASLKSPGRVVFRVSGRSASLTVAVTDQLGRTPKCELAVTMRGESGFFGNRRTNRNGEARFDLLAPGSKVTIAATAYPKRLPSPDIVPQLKDSATVAKTAIVWLPPKASTHHHMLVLPAMERVFRMRILHAGKVVNQASLSFFHGGRKLGDGLFVADQENGFGEGYLWAPLQIWDSVEGAPLNEVSIYIERKGSKDGHLLRLRGSATVRVSERHIYELGDLVVFS